MGCKIDRLSVANRWYLLAIVATTFSCVYTLTNFIPLAANGTQITNVFALAFIQTIVAVATLIVIAFACVMSNKK